MTPTIEEASERVRSLAMAEFVVVTHEHQEHAERLQRARRRVGRALVRSLRYSCPESVAAYRDAYAEARAARAA